MCKYSYFHFLCGGTKLKIAEPCAQASTNFLRLPFCALDPHPHVEDGRIREYVEPTYGPGICSNIHCRENWGMVPKDEADKHRMHDLVEDDAPFDMSPEACQEREDIWARSMLDEDQQMEAYWTKWPLPVIDMSLNAKTWLFPEHFTYSQWFELASDARTTSPDDIDWRELNPKYLSQKALQHVTAIYLPASVTDPRCHKHRITTPMQPQFGPFRVKPHTCLPKVGFCKTCGIYHSKKNAKKLAGCDAGIGLEERLEASEFLSDSKINDLPHCKPLRPELPLDVWGTSVSGCDVLRIEAKNVMPVNSSHQINRVSGEIEDALFDTSAGLLPQLQTNLSMCSTEKWSADSGYDGSFDREFHAELDWPCAHHTEITQAQATFAEDGSGPGLSYMDAFAQSGEYEMMEF